MRHWALAALLASAVTATPALAQDGIRTERVQFKAGTSGASLKGRIKGDQTVDYKLGAKAGQTMTVSLKGSNSSNYFNVLPPGSTGEAIFVGSSAVVQKFEGTLPADGDYTVRVYLMRNAARRNEASDYTLDIGITSPR
jgi:hypothetical protein